MKRTLLALCLLCVAFASGATAQAPAQSQPEAARADKRAARKVDEFGRLYGCDGGAHLDFFAMELMKEPASKGYILARDAERHAPGTAMRWATQLGRYLVEYRGIAEDRIAVVDAGRHGGERLKIEMWLAPEGAEAPAARQTAAGEQRATAGEQKPRAFDGKFDEYGAFDDTQFYDFEGGDAGSYHIGITFDAFAATVAGQKDSRGYIVVYSKPGSAPGYWRRIGTRELQKIARDGAGADRFTIIHGGTNRARRNEYADENDPVGRVELWVAAKDAPPVKHVDDRRRLKESLLVGSTVYFTDDGEVSAWALNNLVELLKSDARVSACIVVYPGNGSPVYDHEADAEKPPPDVFKLAEAWRAELVKKHGVGEGRIVLMHGPPEDYGAGKLEAWAVPAGAELPKPFAERDALGEEEEPEGGASR